MTTPEDGSFNGLRERLDAMSAGELLFAAFYAEVQDVSREPKADAAPYAEAAVSHSR